MLGGSLARDVATLRGEDAQLNGLMARVDDDLHLPLQALIEAPLQVRVLTLN